VIPIIKKIVQRCVLLINLDRELSICSMPPTMEEMHGKIQSYVLKNLPLNIKIQIHVWPTSFNFYNNLYV
jgi:hypothetical protein